MIIQCCVCHKIRKSDNWIEHEEPFEVGSRISHGYCPTCAAQTYAELASRTKDRELAVQ